MLKTVRTVGLIALAFSSTVALADVPMPMTPDMPGTWECVSADNAQHEWIQQGPSLMLAQMWSMGFCQMDSALPHSCHLIANACQAVDVHGRWRCYAADYRERIHWTSARRGPRWHAIQAAYKRCYHSSPHPETCYVNPAVCVHF